MRAAVAALLIAALVLPAGCYDRVQRHYTVPTTPDDGCYRRCKKREPRSVFMDCLQRCQGVIVAEGPCGRAVDGWQCETHDDHRLNGGNTALFVGGVGLVVVIVGAVLLGRALKDELDGPISMPD